MGKQEQKTLRVQKVDMEVGAAELQLEKAAVSDSAAFVQRARAKLGLTQSELADRLGLERRSIMRFERGDELLLHVRLAIKHLLHLHERECRKQHRDDLPFQVRRTVKRLLPLSKWGDDLPTPIRRAVKQLLRLLQKHIV